MLGKLLKHEFRATGRIMLPVFAVLVVLALLFNVSVRYIDNVSSSLLQVLFGLIIFAFIVGIIAAEIIALVLMINRFYKNLLGEQGYLMFTLPVNVHELVWSKLIVSFVWFLLTNLVIFLIIGGTAFSFSQVNLGEIFAQLPSWGEISAMLKEVGVSYGDLILVALEYLLIIILSGLTVCLHFYAAMSLGHSFSNHKVLYSVLFFIGISLAFQFLTSLLGVASFQAIDNGALERYFYEANTPADAIRVFAAVIGGVAVWELVEGAILYVLTTFSLKRHLNLA